MTSQGMPIQAPLVADLPAGAGIPGPPLSPTRSEGPGRASPPRQTVPGPPHGSSPGLRRQPSLRSSSSALVYIPPPAATGREGIRIPCSFFPLCANDLTTVKSICSGCLFHSYRLVRSSEDALNEQRRQAICIIARGFGNFDAKQEGVLAAAAGAQLPARGGPPSSLAPLILSFCQFPEPVFTFDQYTAGFMGPSRCEPKCRLPVPDYPAQVRWLAGEPLGRVLLQDQAIQAALTSVHHLRQNLARRAEAVRQEKQRLRDRVGALRQRRHSLAAAELLLAAPGPRPAPAPDTETLALLQTQRARLAAELHDLFPLKHHSSPGNPGAVFLHKCFVRIDGDISGLMASDLVYMLQSGTHLLRLLYSLLVVDTTGLPVSIVRSLASPSDLQWIAFDPAARNFAIDSAGIHAAFGRFNHACAALSLALRRPLIIQGQEYSLARGADLGVEQAAVDHIYPPFLADTCRIDERRAGLLVLFRILGELKLGLLPFRTVVRGGSLQMPELGECAMLDFRNPLHPPPVDYIFFDESTGPVTSTWSYISASIDIPPEEERALAATSPGGTGTSSVNHGGGGSSSSSSWRASRSGDSLARGLASVGGRLFSVDRQPDVASLLPEGPTGSSPHSSGSLLYSAQGSPLMSGSASSAPGSPPLGPGRPADAPGASLNPGSDSDSSCSGGVLFDVPSLDVLVADETTPAVKYTPLPASHGEDNSLARGLNSLASRLYHSVASPGGASLGGGTQPGGAGGGSAAGPGNPRQIVDGLARFSAMLGSLSLRPGTDGAYPDHGANPSGYLPPEHQVDESLILDLDDEEEEEEEAGEAGFGPGAGRPGSLDDLFGISAHPPDTLGLDARPSGYSLQMPSRSSTTHDPHYEYLVESFQAMQSHQLTRQSQGAATRHPPPPGGSPPVSRQNPNEEDWDDLGT
ncbi:hypothetical protein H696_00350 [Fonticula alba]|uniref:Uncharacterized protein n=1 Tax=Fonticula alba TaxID=691883 RepID=A0A058ZFP0_FONAL|nr:hypothetical protein H696_00350 [Fonticula alba]KCV72771.1 hypothetical protein H696_00350 [Fonticula alba]|eukprot:XP_009492472.1 hypothetical protein H696_00350 [Fonticula alba]